MSLQGALACAVLSFIQTMKTPRSKAVCVWDLWRSCYPYYTAEVQTAADSSFILNSPCPGGHSGWQPCRC